MLQAVPVAEIAVSNDLHTIREGTDSLLAKNLVVARIVAGLTQQELASASRLSRATIAQLETGYSDPRLSTVVELARALGIPTIFLLLGLEDLQALAGLIEAAAVNSEPDANNSQFDSKTSAILRDIPSTDLALMQDYLRTGLLKDRVRAARIGAAVAQGVSAEARLTSVTAGIFSAILPGIGTALGIALAEFLSSRIDRQS